MDGKKRVQKDLRGKGEKKKMLTTGWTGNEVITVDKTLGPPVTFQKFPNQQEGKREWLLKKKKDITSVMGVWGVRNGGGGGGFLGGLSSV